MGFPNLNSALIFASAFLFIRTALITTATGSEENGLNPSPLRLSLQEDEQTSLPCPIDMASMEPLSVVWFRVADVKFNLSTYLPQSVHGDVVPKKVYSDPPALLLNRLNLADTGRYVCNVSYRGGNVTDDGGTKTEAAVELFVAVPQQPPVLTDSQGNLLLGTAGPYAEGDTVRLTCAVSADNLKLSWRRNGEPLSSKAATVAKTPSGGLESHLNLGPLFREDLFSNVSCVATSDVTLPTASSVLIDMFLPPVDVFVWSWAQENADASGWLMVSPSPTKTASSLSASTLALDTKNGGSGTFSGVAIQSATVNSSSPSTFYSPRSYECEATGSRPPANITWFLDGLPLDERLSHTRFEGNITSSVLLLPSLQHAGKLLECRASNDNLREHRGVLSRYLAVNVSNKPEVSIKLGAGLNASHITEGTDVYMECSVLVASRIADVTWRRDGRELDADPTRGRVITSRYLVIRRVTPDHGGSYTCRVTNSRGDTVESIPFLIRVRSAADTFWPPGVVAFHVDPPRCVSNEDLTLSVERDEAVNLTCHVRSDPSEGLRYFWLAENSTHSMQATPRNPTQRHRQLPLPVVTESNSLEFVANASIFNTALACWAENAVGTQKRRCRFTFVRKGVHAPTLNCSVDNYTDSSFTLTCFTPLSNVTMTPPPKLGQGQRLRVQVFDARRGNWSERSFWSTDLGPILVN
ncbi:hypothetical protein MRX96_010304 [Rhipicephalus microplus]